MFAQPLNVRDGVSFDEKKKNSKTYLQSSQRMITNGMRPRLLKGDSEKAYTSKNSLAFYRKNHIAFTAVNVAREGHGCM